MNESRLEGGAPEATLKRGARRSVRSERAPDGSAARGRVVKRWHAAGLAGLLDGRRARREHALARRLADLGLCVPRPLELRRADGRFELVSERIEGAVPLARVLAGDVPWPLRAEALVARLGAQLARLHAAGFEHGDLHAGNVLLDPRGEAWLVDLARARLRVDTGSTRARAARVRDLVQLAVETREVLPERLRARFLVAWSRSAARLGLGHAGTALLALDVERAARLRRRASVARHQGRWTRASGVADAFELEHADARRVRGIVRAGHDPALALDAALATGDDGRPRALGPAAPFGACLVVRRGAALGPRQAWLAAARLEAHHLPAPRPWCLVTGPEELALFGLAAGVERAADASGRDARRLGALAGALADRGLALAGDATHDLWIDGAGVPLFGLTRRVVASDSVPSPAGPFAAAWSVLDARGRSAWTAAWIATWRGGAAERRRLAAEHGRG